MGVARRESRGRENVHGRACPLQPVASVTKQATAFGGKMRHFFLYRHERPCASGKQSVVTKVMMKVPDRDLRALSAARFAARRR